MDRIAVPEIRLEARLGVADEERATPQEILVDVELCLDLRQAGAADDLSSTVDYVEVCSLVEAVVGSRPFRLVEAVAEETARALLERFAVDEARVRVRKPSALVRWGAPWAEVEVRRRRDA
jgi:dihydroneopterin aldolase